jgi:transposase
MPRSRKPYPAEFRQQMVDLVRAGRTPEELSREYEPTATSGISVMGVDES